MRIIIDGVRDSMTEPRQQEVGHAIKMAMYRQGESDDYTITFEYTETVDF